MKSKPADSYKTFRPFLNDKNKGQNRTCINLRTNGEIVKDQNKVADILVSFFCTVADEIGGRDVNSSTEEDFSNHQSVTNIVNANKNMHDSFRFNPLRSNQVQRLRFNHPQYANVEQYSRLLDKAVQQKHTGRGMARSTEERRLESYL